jgi:hypothetical protein
MEVEIKPRRIGVDGAAHVFGQEWKREVIACGSHDAVDLLLAGVAEHHRASMHADDRRMALDGSLSHIGQPILTQRELRHQDVVVRRRRAIL